jgi:ABC-type Mn2+/Zn2+ transport system ATPase subunit
LSIFIGRSGILSLVNGKLHPGSGEVFVEKGKKVISFTKPISPADQRLTIKEYFLLRGCSTHSGSLLNVLEQVKLSTNINRTISSMSPPDRAKVKLAAVLMESPDILVINEPSQFFDDNGMKTLAALLNDLPKTTAIVNSSDEDFLNSFVTDTLYVDPASSGIVQYHGKYVNAKQAILDELKAKKKSLGVGLSKHTGELPTGLDLNEIGHKNHASLQSEDDEITTFNVVMMVQPFLIGWMYYHGAFDAIM